LHTEKFTLSNVTWEILTEAHDLSDFNCSTDDESGVNEFIQYEAKKYQHENMGTTYLFYYKDKIVGFATLSMNSINVKETPEAKEISDWFRKRVPVILLGQIGVDNSVRRRGLGTVICEFCTGLAVDLSQRVGCRYIALHADLKFINLYKKCGFETVHSTSKDGLMVKKLIHLVYVQDLLPEKFIQFKENSEKQNPKLNYQMGPRKYEDDRMIGVYYQIRTNKSIKN